MEWGLAKPQPCNYQGCLLQHGEVCPVTSSSHVFTNPESMNPEFFLEVLSLFWSVSK
jgi:hypothetical protein